MGHGERPEGGPEGAPGETSGEDLPPGYQPTEAPSDAEVTDLVGLVERIAQSGVAAAERDLRVALHRRPGDRPLRALLRRLEQRSHLLDDVADASTVAATLAIQLWPLTGTAVLGRLHADTARHHPTVSWAWEMTSPRLLRVLFGHEGDVQSVAWSPDGTKVASAGDTSVCIWDAVAGDALLVITGHEGVVRSVAWSPDGTRVATAAADGTARIWDGFTGVELVALAGHQGEVNAVAWSPDGTRVASGADDGSARIWDTATGLQLRDFLGHDADYGKRGLTTDGCDAGLLLGYRDHAKVVDVSWSPDGTRLASAADDGAVRLWDPATGDPLGVVAGPGHSPESVAWSPDGTALAICGNSSAVVADAATGAVRARLGSDGDCIDGGIGRLAWSPDGTRIATVFFGPELRIWDATTSEELATLVDNGDFAPESRVAWSPEGTRLVTGSAYAVRIWEAGPGADCADEGPLECYGDFVSLAWSPDSSRLAAAQKLGLLRIWDGATGAELGGLIGREGSAVRAVAWSPDGSRLATSGWRGTRIWDATNGQELSRVGRFDSEQLAWSPGGDRLALASGCNVLVLEPTTGDGLARCDGHRHLVESVAWSPDGTRLASSSIDGTARIWDAATGAELLVLAIRTHPATPICWSPDGTRLAISGDTGFVRVCDAATGTELHLLATGSDDLTALAWSPDGSRLAMADSDGLLSALDASTGRRLFGAVVDLRANCLAYAPSGALAVCTDRAVIVLDSRTSRA